MVDSDDSQMEIAGDARGSDMPDRDWETYGPIYQKALDRYENSTEERQTEKRKFFNDRITKLFGECEENDENCWGQLFWVREGGETGFEQYWTGVQAEEKSQLLEVVKEFHGDRWTKAIEAAEAKAKAAK